MKRLEFISRSLSKIQHKKFELYVISRIIHKLDDPEIKYVFQQYAARDNNTGKYALIDLYLPQLGIAIEVDEAHHKEQYTEDEIRVGWCSILVWLSPRYTPSRSGGSLRRVCLRWASPRGSMLQDSLRH